MNKNEKGFRYKIDQWFKHIWGYMKPMEERCLYCKQSSCLQPQKWGLCDPCYQKIPWIQKTLCSICGRSIACYDCKRRASTFFTMNRSAVQYNDDMKKMLIQYKYRGDERLQVILGNMVKQAFQLLIIENPKLTLAQLPILTYVPISDMRYEERGFNQAKQLAQVVSSLTGIPVIPLLKRSRHTDKQSQSSRVKREENLKNIFEVNREIISEYLYQMGKRKEDIDVIFIVDDVYTTGSTLNECAKTLKNYAEVKIYGISWARS